MQQRSSKAQLEQYLIRVGGLTNYLVSTSYPIFEVGNNIKRDKEILPLNDLIQDSYYIMEMVEICRKVYNSEVFKVRDTKNVLKHLNNLPIKGSLKLSRGVMGRSVIEWNYSINTIRILRMRSNAIIKHELINVKRKDIRLLLEVIPKYNYQVEEEWMDINRGSISCYIGSRVN